MLTMRTTLAAALLAISAAIALYAYADRQAKREAHCVQHVRTSGVPGAAEAAADVCQTDYIKRYTR